MVRYPVLWALVVMATFLTTVLGFRCKWSNEGCQSGEECCSGSCMQSHPGTNPRCTKCTILGDCLYNYHCESRLICGAKRKCCADYWETCSSWEDCCDPRHRCINVRGFVYRKCLYGPVRYPGSSARSLDGNYFLSSPLLLFGLIFKFLYF